MKVYFENTATYITAAHDDGNVVIRCNFSLTDCRDDESIDSFVKRHGGPVLTANYLIDCYSKK